MGFIRNLPKELKAAFRTTFEELDEADLLLHVMDASSGELEEQYETVQALLAELHLNVKPTVVVLNKSDRCEAQVMAGLVERFGGIPICALDRGTFGPLLECLEEVLWPNAAEATV